MHAYHDGVTPVGLDEPDHPSACCVSFHNHDAAIPVHQVKSFLEIKEDSVEGLQLEVRELLRHLCFDDRGASSVVCATAMKAVMQLERLAVIVR